MKHWPSIAILLSLVALAFVLVVGPTVPFGSPVVAADLVVVDSMLAAPEVAAPASSSTDPVLGSSFVL